jgi:hypothetical protein
MEKDVVKDLFKKNNAVIFFDYFVLYAKTIIFSPLSLFLGVWLNIFIMVSWFAFKQGDSFLLSSIVATGVVRNGMYTFLRSLLNIKRVGANDRLRLVPTNRAIEVSAALTWNFIYNLGSTIIFIGIALIFIPTQRVMFENINWLMYVSGYLLLWLSSVLTAYLLYIGFKILRTHKPLPSSCMWLRIHFSVARFRLHRWQNLDDLILSCTFSRNGMR